MKFKITKEVKMMLIGVVVLIGGVLLMMTGMHNGEVAVVLEKAVNICMECIGIG